MLRALDDIRVRDVVLHRLVVRGPPLRSMLGGNHRDALRLRCEPRLRARAPRRRPSSALVAWMRGEGALATLCIQRALRRGSRLPTRPAGGRTHGPGQRSAGLACVAGRPARVRVPQPGAPMTRADTPDRPRLRHRAGPVYLLRQVKSPSIKPWLAGRQPSDRGGVPQVRTWLLPPSGGTQQARVLPPARPRTPTRVWDSVHPIHRPTSHPQRPPGATTRRRRDEQRLVLRDPPDPRRAEPGQRHQRARPAHLPDHQLHVRQHRPRREPVRAQGVRQHLHPDHEPDPGRGRGAHRVPRGRRRGPPGRLRPGRRDPGAAQHRRGRRPHRVQPQPLRRHLQPVPLHASRSWASRSRSSRTPTTWTAGVPRSGPTRRRSSPRPSPTRRTTSSTSRASPASPMRRASRWSWTTPWPPRT